MNDNDHSLEVVTSSSEIIRSGQRARKSSAGYDLTCMFGGFKGTLVIITELSLDLYGIPETIRSAIYAFDSFEGAIRSIIETLRAGIRWLA